MSTPLSPMNRHAAVAVAHLAARLELLGPRGHHAAVPPGQLDLGHALARGELVADDGRAGILSRSSASVSFQRSCQ